jgi:hypothetical protein
LSPLDQKPPLHRIRLFSEVFASSLKATPTTSPRDPNQLDKQSFITLQAKLKKTDREIPRRYQTGVALDIAAPAHYRILCRAD